MTYVPLHHAHRRPALAQTASLTRLQETTVSTVTGALFMLLAAAAGAFSLWLGAGRRLRRRTG